MDPRIKDFLRRREGGDYIPKPGAYDPHPTRWGVTQSTYNRFRAQRGLPPATVYSMTEEEWDAIHAVYLQESGADHWAWPLSLVMADTAFIAGAPQAVKFLQRAVQVKADGVVGPVTRAAVEQGDPRALSINVIGQRIRFHRRLYEQAQGQGKTGHELPPIVGWLNRCKLLEKAALR